MSAFADVLIHNPNYVLLGELYHGKIIIGPDYNPLNLFFVQQIANYYAAKTTDHGSSSST